MESHHLKRTDLFLIRVWREAGKHGEEGSGRSHGAGNAGSYTESEWHGRVQRVTDGESHQFESWQGLVSVLAAMLGGSEPQSTSKAP
jgi:hypothetical protein